MFSHFALSKALGINERIKAICQKKEVRFVDLWDAFYGNRKMYRRDGIHFSEEGMILYGNQLDLNLYKHLSTVANERNRIDNRNSRQMVVNQGNE